MASRTVLAELDSHSLMDRGETVKSPRENLRSVLQKLARKAKKGDDFVQWSDVRTAYKRKTGRQLDGAELNTICGTHDCKKAELMEKHLSDLLVPLDGRCQRVRVVPVECSSSTASTVSSRAASPLPVIDDDDDKETAPADEQENTKPLLSGGDAAPSLDAMHNRGLVDIVHSDDEQADAEMESIDQTTVVESEQAKHHVDAVHEDDSAAHPHPGTELEASADNSDAEQQVTVVEQHKMEQDEGETNQSPVALVDDANPVEPESEKEEQMSLLKDTETNAEGVTEPSTPKPVVEEQQKAKDVEAEQVSETPAVTMNVVDGEQQNAEQGVPVSPALAKPRASFIRRCLHRCHIL